VLRQGPIPRFVHGLIEYVAGVVFIGAPFVLVFESAAATAASVVLGVVVLVVAAASAGPTGIVNQIPLAVHVVLDYILAVFLIAAPFLFGFADEIRQMLASSAVEAQRHVHPSSAALPALRARDRRVEEFSRQRWGRVSAARQPRPATVTGFQAGRRAAARADLGRRRVGGLRAIGRGA